MLIGYSAAIPLRPDRARISCSDSGSEDCRRLSRQAPRPLPAGSPGRVDLADAQTTRWGSSAGVNPERTASDRMARPMTRQHERPGQQPPSGTRRHGLIERSRFRDEDVVTSDGATPMAPLVRPSGGHRIAKRVKTGCNNCKRCTNSGAAELGRKQGKLWANVFTFGSVAAVQAFTADCRACSHKLSLHDTGGQATGNSYATPVAVRQPSPASAPLPPPPAVPAGWYRDPAGQPCSRWWDGTQWTQHTAPMA